VFLGFDPVFPFPFFKRESISFEDPWCDEGWGCCKVLNTCKLQQNGIDFKLHFFSIRQRTVVAIIIRKLKERTISRKKDRQKERQKETRWSFLPSFPPFLQRDIQ
jgi:hypothetical protein